MENKDYLWFFNNELFKDKKELCDKYNLSTCKFKAKIKEKEIIKLK